MPGCCVPAAPADEGAFGVPGCCISTASFLAGACGAPGRCAGLKSAGASSRYAISNRANGNGGSLSSALLAPSTGSCHSQVKATDCLKCGEPPQGMLSLAGPVGRATACIASPQQATALIRAARVTDGARQQRSADWGRTCSCCKSPRPSAGRAQALGAPGNPF